MTIFGHESVGRATAVDFGGVPAAQFQGQHRNSGFPFYLPLYTDITAVSPPGDVSIVDVQVVTGGGQSIASPADQLPTCPCRAILSISSTMASLAGGASLEITGSGLGNATAVNFGTLQATILSNTDNQIVVAVPQSSTYLSAVDVTVATAGGTSATTPDDQISYCSRGHGHAVSVPPSGFISGGDLVTIYGTNLDDATAVDFGQTAGTIVDESADAIDVISPAGAVGAAVVTVVTPGGTAATSKQDPFT